MSGQGTIVEIEIAYPDPVEPVDAQEIIDAYLALYPSSLPESVADTPEHHTQWIRDEMRRVLEYAARDLDLARTGADAQERGFRQREVERWLRRLAEFRERFYATGSGAQFRFEIEKNKIESVKPGSGGVEDAAKQLQWLQQRLGEFQLWWAAHENDAVILPTPGTAPQPTATIRPPKLPAGFQELLDIMNATETPTRVP